MPKKISSILMPDLKTQLSLELIGRAVHAKRTQSQLRLEDAAALCGVAKQTLMNVEHGHPNTRISTILQICTSLGIKITILPWQENNEANNEWQ
jgi:DNA-binding XRE family transcriptional regulator